MREKEIIEALLELASLEGAFVCPEGAAVLAGLKKLRDADWLKAGEIAVLLNTGAGIKYPDILQFDLPSCPVDGTI